MQTFANFLAVLLKQSLTAGGEFENRKETYQSKLSIMVRSHGTVMYCNGWTVCRGSKYLLKGGKNILMVLEVSRECELSTTAAHK